MAERLIFHYQARSTLIHRIDPRVKIVIIFAITASMFSVNFLQFLILSGYVVTGCLIARLPFTRYGRELGFFFLLTAIIFISRWITSGILYEGIFHSIRFLLIVGAGLLLTDSTAPEDLTLALYWFMKPFKFINPERIAARFNLTLSFLPLIFDSILEIQEARKSRMDNVWRHPIRRIISLATQIFEAVLNRAEEITYALESRLFDEKVQHGSISFGRIDFFTLLVTAGVVWGIIFFQ